MNDRYNYNPGKWKRAKRAAPFSSTDDISKSASKKDKNDESNVSKHGGAPVTGLPMATGINDGVEDSGGRDRFYLVCQELGRQNASKLQLKYLPDEVILNVLSYLEFPDLIRMGHVSKRFRDISHDESLWRKMNLYPKKVSTGLLKLIINNGCKYLNLRYSKLVGTLSLDKQKPQLKYLDLHGCRADNQVFQELLSSCHSLRKLSLACLNLDENLIKIICKQNGKSLSHLNLFGCGGLSIKSIKDIVNNCVELTELNLRGTKISEQSIKYLVNNLTPNIEKLSFYGHDMHVKELVRRCYKLKVLDLICKKNLSRSNGVTITNKISSASVNDIIEHLSHSLEELDVTETRISTEKLLELRSMPKLRILNCSNPPITLYKQLPNLGINHGHLKIADSDESYKPQDGFWEIKVKQSCLPESNP